MAIPRSRDEFKHYCLRKLGAPVIEINVEDEQVEDRIDEALIMFQDYHFDGTMEVNYAYQIQEADVTNRYITLPDNIIGAVDLFPIGDAMNTNNLFNIRYQIALNDLYTLTSVSITPYYMAMSNIQFLEQILVGKQPIRYNRHVNNLYIDMDWAILNVGDFLVVKAYQVVDPAEYPKIWGDRWLARYAACIIKQQWGENLSKFSGMKLPGGMTFNGEKIYNDAVAEREKLEKDLIVSYSLPNCDMIN
jgi:hypothetical protein